MKLLTGNLCRFFGAVRADHLIYPPLVILPALDQILKRAPQARCASVRAWARPRRAERDRPWRPTANVMKRMGGSRPFDVERNMSYTNLAAMASSFETSARLVPAGGATRTGGSQAQLETIYAKAQELINTGCELSAECQHSARHRDMPVPVRLCAGCRRTRRTRSRQSSPTRKVPTCCRRRAG